MRTIPRGYHAPEGVREAVHRLSRTTLVMPMLVALVDQGLILTPGLLVVDHGNLPLIFVIFAYAVFAILATRSMRGLECLVHEASHWNWSRRSRRMNDVLANVMAAWPVLSQVTSYRTTHFVHHRELGGDQDTDWVRWQRLHLEDLDRTRPCLFVIGLLKRSAAYVPSWWWAIGVNRKTVVRFLAWHGVYVVSLILILGVERGLVCWLLSWAIPLFILLPGLRFCGEIEEHEYYRSTDVLHATYTNIGWLQRLIFHPHGDGYHTAHHLFPSVPFYRVRRLHQLLVARDAIHFGAEVPVRHGVLDVSTGSRSRQG
jgi:fatty acid desaturase